jgi:hypothetical protein
MNKPEYKQLFKIVCYFNNVDTKQLMKWVEKLRARLYNIEDVSISLIVKINFTNILKELNNREHIPSYGENKILRKLKQSKTEKKIMKYIKN